VVLSLGLIYKFGFAGAVLGTTASLILASVYFMSMFHRRTGYSVSQVLQEGYLKPMFCSVLILAVLFAIRPAKGLSWFGLVGMVVAFGGFYSTAILLSRFFDEYDWNKMESFIPAARYLRRVSRIA
jgi:O-antigen/teichoic acid export membrane protein